MSQAHSNAKRRTFKHINSFQLRWIQVPLRLSVHKRWKLPKKLGIARSTLYEKIKQGAGMQKHSDLSHDEQYFAQTETPSITMQFPL